MSCNQCSPQLLFCCRSTARSSLISNFPHVSTLLITFPHTWPFTPDVSSNITRAQNKFDETPNPRASHAFVQNKKIKNSSRGKEKRPESFGWESDPICGSRRWIFSLHSSSKLLIGPPSWPTQWRCLSQMLRFVTWPSHCYSTGSRDCLAYKRLQDRGL